MELIGLRVKHNTLGTGEVIECDGKYIKVKFDDGIHQFRIPNAFGQYIWAEDDAVQQAFDQLNAARIAEEELRRIEQAQRDKEEEERRAEAMRNAQARLERMLFNRKFPADYHPEHVSYDVRLTYEQVEDRFGIQRKGYGGRGINPIDDAIVLFSSVDYSGGNFVYHDKWTEDGDYLYSGEGSSGDQTMTGGNLAIKNAAKDGKKILLFVKRSSKEYYYQGVFVLVDYTQEDRRGEDGKLRKEYVFRLRRVQPSPAGL